MLDLYRSLKYSISLFADTTKLLPPLFVLFVVGPKKAHTSVTSAADRQLGFVAFVRCVARFLMFLLTTNQSF